MNIVKLKDILMPENNKMSTFFNENLKGKYAYWVKMRYIFPLESLDYKTYIQYEQKDLIYFLGTDVKPHIDLYSEDSCMIDFASKYIDLETTETINSINSLMIQNAYTTDYDLDINMIRNFRSWLAGELLFLNSGVEGYELNMYSLEQIHMLEYYKNDMYNDVVKYLNVFGTDTPNIYNPTTSCGCCNNTSNLQISNINNVCNTVNIYRNNIHKLMVSTFENVSFWSSLDKDFIALFKKYIDNILRLGLIVSTDIMQTECICKTVNDTKSENILKRLSISLDYIYNDQTAGHMNYIHDALYDWAEYLYDNMSWKIK